MSTLPTAALMAVVLLILCPSQQGEDAREEGVVYILNGNPFLQKRCMWSLSLSP